MRVFWCAPSLFPLVAALIEKGDIQLSIDQVIYVLAIHQQAKEEEVVRQSFVSSSRLYILYSRSVISFLEIRTSNLSSGV
ncbi:hypothetical protein RV18_GL000607 [Enterococcus termitis]|nr:hypothetical protein RV18_GL000607 [Enterococcus termitis]